MVVCGEKEREEEQLLSAHEEEGRLRFLHGRVGREFVLCGYAKDTHTYTQHTHT